MAKKQIVHGSTFSGIGAPEVAAEMLGWHNAFHCEINPFGREVLDYYFPNAESYEDITKQDFSKWRGKITVLTGGFPCQPFSYAGKRRGSEDDRYLWPFMLKCIQEVRPTWFVGENVAGITTMVFPGEDVKVGSETTLFGENHHTERHERYVIEEICQQIEAEGYSVQPMLIPACAVGAPHRRDRVFFIAHRNDDVEDTMHSGLMGREHDEQGSERNIGDACARGAERICGEEGTEMRMAEAGSSKEIEREMEWDVSDPYSDGFQRWLLSGCNNKRWRNRPGEPPLLYANGFRSVELRERWRTFPTVSPVYRGNDGLPFDVDNLTIPFSRWKKESLKAYGNAIVVQVMYRIFEAIDKIENEDLQLTKTY